MLDVIIALCPAFLASLVFFGYRALLVTLVCIISCVIFEYIARYLMKREQTISDLSAVVTGLLLALSLPVTVPFFIAVIGSFFAIVIVKQLFGGIGQNFANPAVTARVLLLTSFASHMTHWVNPLSVDAVSSATPLVDIQAANPVSLLIGNIPGSLGETSALALLLGGIYLVLRKVIAPTIPVIYIGSVFLFSLVFGADPLQQILAGGLMLGAIFMATDYATSPMTTKGKVIFALGCGLLTTVIRLYGGFPESVSFAILFMNLFVPLIDQLTRTRPFGTKTKQRRSYRFVVKPTLVLTCIASLIAMLLAVTYQLTGIGDMVPGLTEQQLEEYGLVLQTDRLNPVQMSQQDERILGVYTDSQKQGIAIHLKTTGYAGPNDPIELLIGFDTDQVITGVVVVSHSETPGIGTRIESPEYLQQFIGVKNSASDVDTITGATVSSSAVRQGVDYAFSIVDQIQQQATAS